MISSTTSFHFFVVVLASLFDTKCLLVHQATKAGYAGDVTAQCQPVFIFVCVNKELNLLQGLLVIIIQRNWVHKQMIQM